MLKIHCPICKNIFQKNDEVVKDFINTITHSACYTGRYEFITDRGTYMEIVEKYPFFQESIH